MRVWISTVGGAETGLPARVPQARSAEDCPSAGGSPFRPRLVGATPCGSSVDQVRWLRCGSSRRRRPDVPKQRSMTRAPSQNGLRAALLWDATPGAARLVAALRAPLQDSARQARDLRGPGQRKASSRPGVYGMATSLAVDPVEKKAALSFFPGARALSLATVGCNFSCKHCQNHEISQWARHRSPDAAVPGRFIPPEDVIRGRRAEPLQGDRLHLLRANHLSWKYALESRASPQTARPCRASSSPNGFMTEAVELVAPYLHGANVDLKGMDDRIAAP